MDHPVFANFRMEGFVDKSGQNVRTLFNRRWLELRNDLLLCYHDKPAGDKRAKRPKLREISLAEIRAISGEIDPRIFCVELYFVRPIRFRCRTGKNCREWIDALQGRLDSLEIYRAALETEKQERQKATQRHLSRDLDKGDQQVRVGASVIVSVPGKTETMGGRVIGINMDGEDVRYDCILDGNSDVSEIIKNLLRSQIQLRKGPQTTANLNAITRNEDVRREGQHRPVRSQDDDQYIRKPKLGTDYDEKIQLITLGDSSVGKTALLRRYTLGKFEATEATLGISQLTKIVKFNINGKSRRLLASMW